MVIRLLGTVGIMDWIVAKIARRYARWAAGMSVSGELRGPRWRRRKVAAPRTVPPPPWQWCSPWARPTWCSRYGHAGASAIRWCCARWTQAPDGWRSRVEEWCRQGGPHRALGGAAGNSEFEADCWHVRAAHPYSRNASGTGSSSCTTRSRHCSDSWRIWARTGLLRGGAPAPPGRHVAAHQAPMSTSSPRFEWLTRTGRCPNQSWARSGKRPRATTDETGGQGVSVSLKSETGPKAIYAMADDLVEVRNRTPRMEIAPRRGLVAAPWLCSWLKPADFAAVVQVGTDLGLPLGAGILTLRRRGGI